MFKLVVLSVVLAAVAANPSGLWGAGLAAPLAAGWGGHWGAGYAAPLAAPLAAVAAVGAHNYRGPLSLAPGQPANILAHDGRPLDTLSVNVDKLAHFTAKAVDGHGHWLKKRSVVAAPLVAAPLAAAPLGWGHAARWVAPAHAPVVAAAPWGLGVGARYHGHLW